MRRARTVGRGNGPLCFMIIAAAPVGSTLTIALAISSLYIVSIEFNGPGKRLISKTLECVSIHTFYTMHLNCIMFVRCCKLHVHGAMVRAVPSSTGSNNEDWMACSFRV